MPTLVKPLTQTKYGLLTPIEHIKGSGWLCSCDCGAVTIVDANKMRRGKVKSCGCFRKTNGSNAVLRAQAKNDALVKAGQPMGYQRALAYARAEIVRPSFLIGKNSGTKPCWCCRRPTRGEMVCGRCLTNDKDKPAGRSEAVNGTTVSRPRKKAPSHHKKKGTDSVPDRV